MNFPLFVNLNPFPGNNWTVTEGAGPALLQVHPEPPSKSLPVRYTYIDAIFNNKKEIVLKA